MLGVGNVVRYIATPRGPRYPDAPPATTSMHDGTTVVLGVLPALGSNDLLIESKPEFHPSM